MVNSAEIELIEQDNPIQQLVQLYYSYRDKGLESAAFQILVSACKTATTQEDINKTARILDDLILQSNKLDLAASILQNIIKPILCKEEREEPVLLFHLFGWLYGGAERALTSVTNYLTQRNKVILAVFEPIENTGFELDSRTTFVPICGETSQVHRLFLFAKLLRPDIFIGNNNSIPDFVKIYPALSEEGIKTIAYNHEYYFFPHNHDVLFDSVIEKNIALAKANASCFLTGFSANAYGLINSNAAIMPNPNSFQVQSEINFNPNGKTILAVGRFSDSIKRLDRLLKAFHLVIDRHPDAKLIVVGPYNFDARIPHNSNETISELIKKLNFTESQLKFVGKQDRTDGFYQEADLFVMTSDNEGFALVLTEAGSYGLPAVLFSIPGLDDIISEGQNGYIVCQDDINGMANKISDIFDDVETRYEMSVAARDMAERFTIERIGARWDELIHIVVSNENQAEIDRLLSLKFMDKVKSVENFTKLVSLEYEKTAIKIAKSQQIKESDRNIISEKLKYNLKNYGYKVTFKKIWSKIKKLLHKYYYRLRRKLRI